MRGVVGRNPVLPASEVARLHRWAAYGKSIREVAQNLGIGPAAVRKYLRVEHKKPYRSAPPDSGSAVEGEP